MRDIQQNAVCLSDVAKCAEARRRRDRRLAAVAAVATAVAALPSCVHAATFADTLYITNGNSVIQFSTAGTQTNSGPASTPAGSLGTGAQTTYGLAFDNSGNLYVSSFVNSEIYEIPASNPSTAIAYASVTSPTGLAFYNGTLYAASYQTASNNISEITTGGSTGTVSTYTNISGSPALFGMVVDNSGNLYVADGNNIAKISPNGGSPTINTTWATGGSGVKGLSIDSNNDVFAVANGGSAGFISELASSGGVATGGLLTTDEIATSVNGAVGVAVDPLGNVYFDPGNQGSQTIFEATGGSGTQVETITTDGLNDRFMLFAPVAAPEPASLGILGFSSLALLRRRRRRR